jgi:hypothetical protein
MGGGGKHIFELFLVKNFNADLCIGLLHILPPWEIALTDCDYSEVLFEHIQLFGQNPEYIHPFNRAKLGKY